MIFSNIVSFISLIPLIYEGVKPLILENDTSNVECPRTTLNKYAIVITAVMTFNIPLKTVTSVYISDFLTLLTLGVLSNNSLIFLYILFRVLLQLREAEAMYMNMLIIALNLHNQPNIILILSSILFYDSMFKPDNCLFFNIIKRTILNIHICLLCNFIWKLSYHCSNIIDTDVNKINYIFVFVLMTTVYYIIHTNTESINKTFASNMLHFVIVTIYAYYSSTVFFSTVGKEFLHAKTSKTFDNILQQFNKDIIYIGYNEKIHVFLNMETIYYLVHTMRDIYEKHYAFIFHHIVSIILIKLVDVYSIHNIAIVISFLYSITNPLLSLAKLLHKSSFKRLSIIPMTLFSLQFTVSRVICGGYVYMIAIKELYRMFSMTLFVVILLYTILYTMQIIWLKKIINVLIESYKKVQI